MASDLSSRTEAVERGLVALTTTALRHRRDLLLPPLLLMLVIGVYSLLQPREYTSAASFVPSASGQGASKLAGFAAQLGVSVGGEDPSQTSDFYADFLTSPTVLRRLAVTRVWHLENSDTVYQSVMDFLEVDGATEARKVEAAAKILASSMGVSTNFKTSLVVLVVNTTDPYVSKQLVEADLDIVNEFNLRRRQVQATREREYNQTRAGEAELELRTAENRLQEFVQRNRSYDAPALKFEFDRLTRDMTLREEIYKGLLAAQEQARLDAARNVPLITVVEAPILAARPDSRRIVLKVILGGLMGLMIGVVLVLVREYSVTAGSSAERDALRGEWGEARRELAASLDRFRHPFRRRE